MTGPLSKASDGDTGRTFTLDLAWFIGMVGGILLGATIGAAYALAASAIFALAYMALFTWRVRRAIKRGPA